MKKRPIRKKPGPPTVTSLALPGLMYLLNVTPVESASVAIMKRLMAMSTMPTPKATANARRSVPDCPVVSSEAILDLFVMRIRPRLQRGRSNHRKVCPMLPQIGASVKLVSSLCYDSRVPTQSPRPAFCRVRLRCRASGPPHSPNSHEPVIFTGEGVHARAALSSCKFPQPRARTLAAVLGTVVAPRVSGRSGSPAPEGPCNHEQRGGARYERPRSAVGAGPDKSGYSGARDRPHLGRARPHHHLILVQLP